MDTKPKVGRPLKIKSRQELIDKVEAYFKQRDKEGKPYAICALSLALGFASRQTLLEYEHKEEFGDIIQRAKLRCEAYTEDLLYTSRQVAGLIFNLINNYKWKNKFDITTEGKYDKRIAENIRAMTSEDVEKRFRKLSKEIKKEIKKDKQVEAPDSQNAKESELAQVKALPIVDMPLRIKRDDITIKRAQGVAKG